MSRLRRCVNAPNYWTQSYCFNFEQFTFIQYSNSTRKGGFFILPTNRFFKRIYWTIYLILWFIQRGKRVKKYTVMHYVAGLMAEVEFFPNSCNDMRHYYNIMYRMQTPLPSPSISTHPWQWHTHHDSCRRSGHIFSNNK